MQKILRMRVLMHVHPQKNMLSSGFRPWRILANAEKGHSIAWNGPQWIF
jgi:hypothetical protein